MLQRPYLMTLFYGITSLFLVLGLLFYPQQAFEASLRGLKIWWDVVFPALLPFFITSEILMGFGVVHFLGVLLEPFMRPVFNVPGTGAFVLAMGLASGYPISAKLTARLREQKLISRSEGERLVSFTTTADPLFIFGAVAVGFFHDVSLGIMLALAHYTSSILVGILMRFHDPNGEKTTFAKKDRLPLFLRALQAMHQARMKDGRALGQLMGDAVASSLHTLLMVGGFIIMFSVIINVMTLVKLTSLFAAAVRFLMQPLGIPGELASAVIAGFFEVTLGSQFASQAPPTVSMMHKIAVVGAIVAWSSLSVHAQVASILSKSDIRFAPYLFARFLHAVLACVITLLFWKPVQKKLASANIPVFLQQVSDERITRIWDHFAALGSKAAIVLAVLVLAVFAFRRLARLRPDAKKPR